MYAALRIRVSTSLRFKIGGTEGTLRRKQLGVIIQAGALRLISDEQYSYYLPTISDVILIYNLL